MPNRFIKIDEFAPILGMNNVDDEKTLQPGECVNLVNCRPGNPVEPRKGITGVLISSSSTWRPIPKGIGFESGGSVYRIVWMYDSSDTKYHIKAIPEDTDGTDVVDMGYAGFVSEPLFSFLKAHTWLYMMFPASPSSWSVSNNALQSKVAETSTIIRDLCIAAQAAVTSIAQGEDDVTPGPFQVDDCIAYSFTFVRRNDSSSFLASADAPTSVIEPASITTAAQESTTFLPGLVESIPVTANIKSHKIVSGGTTNFYIRILYGIGDAFKQAIDQGATHIRICRSRVQTTTALAEAATKYWLVDVPLGKGSNAVATGDVSAANDTITITGHQLGDGFPVLVQSTTTPPAPLVATTVYYAIRVDANTIKLATSAANAVAGTAIDLTDAGTGTHTVTLVYDDYTTDAALEGEINTSETDGYTVAPYGAYSEFSKNRLWIYTDSGKGYYSEVPGGPGDIDNELAVSYPQKYASMFKPTSFYIDCDSEDGTYGTGVARIGDDLYFFKEKKIFVLYGSDPTLAVPTLLTDRIGLVFPHTLTKCEIKGFFGQCLLFVSNLGPYIIKQGGDIRPFTEFKVRQLLPQFDDDLLFSNLDTNRDWIINNCSAEYFDNEWHVMYLTYAGVNKIWTYYFDPRLQNDNSAPHGAYQIEVAEV